MIILICSIVTSLCMFAIICIGFERSRRKVIPMIGLWLLGMLLCLGRALDGLESKSAELLKAESKYILERTKAEGLQIKLTEMVEDAKEVEILNGTITKLEKSITTLKSTLSDYSTSVQNMREAHKQTVKNLEDELHFRENQVIKLHQSVDSFKKINSDLMTENAVLKNRLRCE